MGSSVYLAIKVERVMSIGWANWTLCGGGFDLTHGAVW